MGFIAARVESKSQKILLKEATKLGLSPQALGAIDLADKQAGVLHTLAISVLGGGSTPTKILRYQLSVDGRPTVFVRPFAGGIMHPAEVHAIISGAPAEAVALTADGQWLGDADALRRHEGLQAALKKFSWRLQTHVMFSLPWALQVRSLGGGKSHLVMKSGSYTGLFSVTYGLAHFKVIAAAVEQALASGHAPEQQFALPCFGDLALQTLRS
jgi:hypothetical protein